MNQSPSTIGLSKSSVETRDIISYIKKRKWTYLSLVILTGMLSFYILKFKILEYSATASFFVNDNNIITSSTLELKALESISSSGDNFNRIYQMINSAATQKHLIKKFDLLKHYGIDSTKEFSYERAIELVRSKIGVKQNPYNAISVTVNDKYRYLSADMANEIVSFIETLNQEFYINNIQNKVQVSQAYVSQLEQDNIKKSVGIDSLISKINYVITSGHLSQNNSYYLLSHQQMLSGLINIFQTSTIDLINSQKLYNLSLQALNFKIFPTITVLRSAMPASRSIALTAMLYSILIMVMVSMLIIIQVYLILHYKDYLIFIFTGK